MVVYGAFMMSFINNPNLLGNFGFYQKSYFVSFYLFTYFYSVSLDVLIRCCMRAINRKHEFDADAYAVEQGYGEPLRDSLIRCSAKSLDTLFTSHFDQLMTADHPTLHDRLAKINDLLRDSPDLKAKEQRTI